MCFTVRAPIAWVLCCASLPPAPQGTNTKQQQNSMLSFCCCSGHAYYFLEDVYPRMTGRRPLKTPGIIKAMFPVDDPIRPAAFVQELPAEQGVFGFGEQPRQQQQQQPQQQPAADVPAAGAANGIDAPGDAAAGGLQED